MRIQFSTLKRPKFVAKQVRDRLNLGRDPGLHRIALAFARDVTGRMFGYRDWHELDRCVGMMPASPYDEDCGLDVASARRARQAAALVSAGLSPDAAAACVEALTPSARRPGRANAPVATSTRPERLDLLDLLGCKAEDMLVAFKKDKVHATRFYSDPPLHARRKLLLRASDFIRIRRGGPEPLAA